MSCAVPQSDSKDMVDQDSTLPDASPLPKEEDSLGGSNTVAQGPSNANVKLEDLFDEDDDEEFPSSGVSKEDAPSSSPPPSPL